MNDQSRHKGHLPQPSGMLWMGAPALVVLACVTTPALAVDAGLRDAGLNAGVSIDLGWIVSGGVSHSVDRARVAIAQQATFLIQVLDRSPNRTVQTPGIFAGVSVQSPSAWVMADQLTTSSPKCSHIQPNAP